MRCDKDSVQCVSFQLSKLLYIVIWLMIVWLKLSSEWAWAGEGTEDPLFQQDARKVHVVQ